ncbi:MAG: glycosyltransferase family 2 protein [Gemmatimonadaceae bacterium]
MRSESFPTVYCVIPVHNRKQVTKRCLEYLDVQDYPAIHVVIVDDGSTDGTSEFLAQREAANLDVIKGDGNLWWSGAMRAGMNFVSILAGEHDYLLMLNDDVRIERDYVSTLVKESVNHGNAVVGSAQRDESNGRLLGSGVRIDFWGMRFLSVAAADHKAVDAVPGRGVLFPYAAVRSVGDLHSTFFPHYLADLEYTFRVRNSGWRVIVSPSAAVFTSSERSDTHVRQESWVTRRFSWRSKDGLLQRLLFFSIHGPWLLRFVALPRLLLVGGYRFLTRQ